MKVIASIPAYKESLFLDYAIRSIYQYVDEIIIINTAMRASLDLGYAHGYQLKDGTNEIIQKWEDKFENVHVISSVAGPKTFKELMDPGLVLAKKLGGDWLFTVGADEIWPKQTLLPMKTILGNCDKNGILGLNVWMHMFAPDFWHCKDFRNPRFAKITPDCALTHGDSMCWPALGVYQFAGDTMVSVPQGTPDRIAKVNSDYPRQLRAFHYSCVGEERVKFKSQFYKSFDGSNCDRYVDAYMKKEWSKFKEMGFKVFTGKHTEVMMEHPMFEEKLI